MSSWGTQRMVNVVFRVCIDWWSDISSCGVHVCSVGSCGGKMFKVLVFRFL